jgi:hypothetical protein
LIKFLSHIEIDKVKWDSCIDNSPQAIVYANSWYLDIVSPGWHALIEDDYASVFPLTWRKKWGISYLYQPAFTQQLGSFGKNENALKEFLSSIPFKFRLVEIQINTFNSGSLIPFIFQTREKITHHLDLNFTVQELEKNFSENTRRNIKRFEKTSLPTSEAGSVEGLVKLFQENRGRELSGLKDSDYSIFISLCQEAEKRNKLICYSALDAEGNIIAGIILIKTHKGYILLFTALSNAGKETGAMSALIAKFIREHAGEKGMLDFEGSMDPGIARFYKSFGSHEIVYLQLKKNGLPLFIRWLKN